MLFSVNSINMSYSITFKKISAQATTDRPKKNIGGIRIIHYSFQITSLLRTQNRESNVPKQNK
jgi:hypothetical protein